MNENKTSAIEQPVPERHNVYCGNFPSNHNRLCAGSPQKVPPYNTGKVLIGSAYQPKLTYQMSATEERLQEALIGMYQAQERRSERRFLIALFFVAAIGLPIAFATS